MELKLRELIGSRSLLYYRYGYYSKRLRRATSIEKIHFATEKGSFSCHRPRPAQSHIQPHTATYSPYQLVPTGVRFTAQYTVKIVTWPSAWKYAKNNVSSIFNRINNNSPSPSQNAQLYCYQLIPTVICDRADSSWLEPRMCTLSPSLGCIPTSSSGVCCIYSSLPASSVSRACSSWPSSHCE